MLISILALALTAGPVRLTLDVKPAGVEVKVDGKRVGTSGKALAVNVKPGKHLVRLSYKGDAHEEEIAVKAGQNMTYSWEFSGSEPSKPNGEDGPSLGE
jgi:PEGA domain